MDGALRAWLEESISADLLLGVHWFQEKVQQQTNGSRSRFKPSWSDLYREDGSSLVINPGYHSEESNLRLAQIVAVGNNLQMLFVESLLTFPCADIAAHSLGRYELRPGEHYSRVRKRHHSTLPGP
jgi:hypothetical protein